MRAITFKSLGAATCIGMLLALISPALAQPAPQPPYQANAAVAGAGFPPMQAAPAQANLVPLPAPYAAPAQAPAAAYYQNPIASLAPPVQPAQYAGPNLPTPPGSYIIGPAPPSPEPLAQSQLKQLSTWYTSVDYFHWNERVAGADFVNEAGTLFTLGYQHRFGQERLRAEFFDGDMAYHGGLQLNDGSIEPAEARTRYLGGRAEIEHLFDPEPWPDATILIGLGTRFWIRDIRGGFGDFGDWSDESQETWWTLYPYLGLELRRPLSGGAELFTDLRVGATALGYDYSNSFHLPVYPKMGVVAALEMGVRGPHLSASARAEVMTWSRSADQIFSTTDSSGNLLLGYVDQPTSTMLLLGGRVSYSY